MNLAEVALQNALMHALTPEDQTTLDDGLFDTTGDDDITVTEVTTYEGAGLMTGNAGIVVTLSDGTEYRLTIAEAPHGGAR